LKWAGPSEIILNSYLTIPLSEPFGSDNGNFVVFITWALVALGASNSLLFLRVMYYFYPHVSML